MMASGVLPRSRSGSPSRTPVKRASGLGLSFDPYDYSLLPKRLIALGSAANFPSVVNLIGDVFNAPVYAPLSDANIANAGPRARHAPPPSAGAATPGPSSGSLTPTHTAGGSLSTSGMTSTAITMSAAATQAAQAAHLPPGVVPAPSRASAALGSAYLACWAYRRRTRQDERFESFEDEIRSLLRGSAELARAERKATGAGAYGHSHSGTTTPLARSGLGIPSPLLEQEEDDRDEDTDSDDNDHVLLPQQRTPVEESGLYKASSMTSLLSNTANDLRSSQSGSTLMTSPSSAALSPGYQGNLTLNTAFGSTPPSGPATATPQSAAVPTSQPATLNVAPLPSEYTDIDVGLVKVSDCDIDSFMMYAALVPEYCRLEGMLVRALV
jgi:xylulokinase